MRDPAPPPAPRDQRARSRPALARAVLWLFGVALALPGCPSPEARRTRGGGPGADPGNRGPEVNMHGRPDPFHGTPRKDPPR